MCTTTSEWNGGVDAIYTILSKHWKKLHPTTL